MTLLGAVGLKIVFTDAYLHYVNPWMRWPILAASLVLIALSIRNVFVEPRDAPEHETHVPHVTWLLLLPALVLYVIAPPELGAYAAERRTGVSAPRPTTNPSTTAGSSAVVETLVSEFVSLAQWEPAKSLTSPVALTGFVSKAEGDWYVTRMGISCCAADAIGWRVRVVGAPAPERDQWVTVTGTWIDPDKLVPRIGDPAITATEVTFVQKPRNTYE